MRSIRSKITVLIVAAIVISSLAIGIISIRTIRTAEDQSAETQMVLISRNCQQTVDSYLNSVEQSVLAISRFAEEDLRRSGSSLRMHLNMVDQIFQSVAKNTSGVLTYYYRIAPEISEDTIGFWYLRNSHGEFTSQKMTDVTAFDPEDINHVGWYTIPKERGEPTWLDPYYNENLGMDMISFVAPIYYDGIFIGVIGIDVKLDTLVEQVENITILDSGYGILTDAEGNIVYHPEVSRGVNLSEIGEGLDPEEIPPEDPLVRYEYEGTVMRAACTHLANGMALFATAPQDEINAGWTSLFTVLLAAGLLILVGFSLAASLIASHITEPLRRLTEAAVELDGGNYDVALDYDRDDEVGILTGVFRQVRDHLKNHIDDLSDLAYKDALTQVRNKGAFNIHAHKLNEELEKVPAGEPVEFGVCMFDCNGLKTINDDYGHEKGDIYLKTACSLICRIFRYSPVFRLGGDEFAVILQNEDFRNREMLLEKFDARAAALGAEAEPWDRVDAAKGMAVFDPARDRTVEDVLKRADDRMYEEKRQMKRTRAGAAGTAP